jgi:predicted Fe-Mo cluster-binding NifX family protein
MKIAIPLKYGKLSQQFGHSEKFALVEVDLLSRMMVKWEELHPPPHQPGLWPRWLAERGVDTVISGSIGQRAQSIFEHLGIELIVGARTSSPKKLLADYLSGVLEVSGNACGQ